MKHSMYTFRLHTWGVVLIALGTLVVGTLLGVGGCLVGEWRADRAAGAAADSSSVPGTGAPGGAAPGAGEPAVPPAPGAPAPPVGYALRLGTFGSQEEAQAFADQAAARGYTPSVLPEETSGGTPFWNVTVGSYASRWEARGAARELAEREARRGWRAVVVPLPAPP